MISRKLSFPILLNSRDLDENINLLYEYFKENIMNPKNRKKLFGKFIYVDCNNWIDSKNEFFWHLISLDEKESFNILPCNNCISYSLCPGANCINHNRTITLSNGKKRSICLYRGMRINWINDIIELANSRHPDVMIWKEDIKGKKYNKKLYMRFKQQEIDYTLVFEERYKKEIINDYFFITAFPTFYINKKMDFDRRYKNYITKMIKQK